MSPEKNSAISLHRDCLPRNDGLEFRDIGSLGQLSANRILHRNTIKLSHGFYSTILSYDVLYCSGAQAPVPLFYIIVSLLLKKLNPFW